jgi:osmotically-inducible protein OsmY
MFAMKRIAYLTLILFLTGCAQPQKQETEAKPAFRAMGQSIAVESSRNDEAIGREVRRRLELLGAPDTAGIVVEVNDGVVTLSGAAPTTAAAWQAEAAARAVNNVKGVVNNVVARNAVR